MNDAAQALANAIDEAFLAERKRAANDSKKPSEVPNVRRQIEKFAKALVETFKE